jgi:CMP-2-keto-3-deoxyoctulosonic acid synthetase
VSVVEGAPSLGVDTQEDLLKVRALYVARAKEAN